MVKLKTTIWLATLLVVLPSFLFGRTLPDPEGDSVTAKPTLILQETIRGKLAPKSVVYSGNGLFFAQNMMYRHTIAVYNQEYELVSTIEDGVKLSEYGYEEYGPQKYRGAPVEATFTHQGKYAWVSNYRMFGDSLNAPGCDGCSDREKYDPSFIYRINTSNFEIEQVIRVGAVPKFMAATPNNRLILVSNWSSADLSVVDTETNREVKRIKLGRFPRGIAINGGSTKAYVAIMGSNKIAAIDLETYAVTWIEEVGRAPRHLCIDAQNRYLYASINNENKVIKIDLATQQIVDRVRTAQAPRSMVLSADNQFLYVVNYFANQMSKIRVEDMSIVETVDTKSKPIGITYDPQNDEVWVACYSGALMVFQETEAKVRFETELPPQLLSLSEARFHRSCFNEAALTASVTLDKDIPSPALPWKVIEPVEQQMTLSEEPEEVPTLVAEVEEKPQAQIVAEVVEKDPVVSVPVETIAEPETVVDKVVEPAAEVEQPELEVESTVQAPYLIIGGSFKVKKNAHEFRDELETKGYKSEIVKRSNGFYMVSYVRTADAKAAKVKLARIKKDINPSAWVYLEK